MSESKVDGACLCGSVRFRVQLPSLVCAHCHCSMCRRNHGAGFVTWFSVHRKQLEVVEGGEILTRYASSDHGSRSFCSRCGSSLFCELEERPEHVDIPLANMEGAIDRDPQLHVFYSDRAPWVRVEDGLPRLGGATGMEQLDPAPDA